MGRVPMTLPGVAALARVPAGLVDDYKSRGWQESGKSKAGKKPADEAEKPAGGDKKSKASKKPAGDNKTK